MCELGGGCICFLHRSINVFRPRGVEVGVGEITGSPITDVEPVLKVWVGGKRRLRSPLGRRVEQETSACRFTYSDGSRTVHVFVCACTQEKAGCGRAGGGWLCVGFSGAVREKKTIMTSFCSRNSGNEILNRGANRTRRIREVQKEEEIRKREKKM